MAIDTWLWEQHHLGQHPSCLRFYHWQPAAISYGYHQTDLPEHWHTLAWGETHLDVVRRPTGGRAVLHQGDLTYALVTTLPKLSRRQAYGLLSQFLIQGCQRLGMELRLGSDFRNYQRHVNCFASATHADLVLDDGYKLIGSAQAWKGSTVLQHGSIRLNPDPRLWQEVFQAPLTTTTLSLPSEATLMSSLTAALTDVFQAPLIENAMTAREWQEIQQQSRTSWDLVEMDALYCPAGQN